MPRRSDPKESAMTRRQHPSDARAEAYAAAAEPESGTDGLRLAVLEVPAAEEYVALVRLCTLHLVGGVGLGAARVSDLRLAVAEACGTFLGSAPAPGPPRSVLRVRFDLLPDCLRIRLAGRAPAGWPDRDALGWLVLGSLVGDLCWEHDGDSGLLTLVEHLPAAGEFRFAAL
jgi:hypothetical protein